MLVDC